MVLLNLEISNANGVRDLLDVITKALREEDYSVELHETTDRLTKTNSDCAGMQDVQNKEAKKSFVRISLGSEQDPKYIQDLHDQLQSKECELNDLENHLTTALQSIKTFHVQQKELFDEFVALREKYDSQKKYLNSALWDYFPSAEGPLQAIPGVTPEEHEVENGIGNYVFGVNLGEGQFAHVRACSLQSAQINRVKRTPAGLRRTASDLGTSFKAGLATSDGDSTNFNKSGTNQEKEDTQENALRRKADGKARHDLAVKIIQKDKIVEARDVYRINNEIKILSEISHPNIVQLEDVIHTNKFLYIVMKRGGEDLFEYVTKRRERGQGPMPIATIRSILAQLVSSVSFLHAEGICHRDLKPENILLDIHGHLTIVDFGLCESIGIELTASGSVEGSTTTSPKRFLSDFCGSPGFFAPEMITAKEYNGFLCDVWSVGCIFLELLLGRENFTKMWMGSYTMDVLTDICSFRNEIQRRSSEVLSLILNDKQFEHIRDECSDILQGLLCVDTELRWSLKRLHSHPWLEGLVESFSKPVSKASAVKSIISPVKKEGGNRGGETKLESRLNSIDGSTTTTLPMHEEKCVRILSTPASGRTLLRSSDRPHSADAGMKSLGARRHKILSVETGFNPDHASPTTIQKRAGQLRLPPINAPDTPKVRSVKKILDSGKELLKNVGISSESPTRLIEK